MAEGTTAPKNDLVISFDEVTCLISELGPEYMAYAIRLLSYQAYSGRGIHDENGPSYLGISKRKWNTLTQKLQMFFTQTTDQRWESNIIRSQQTTIQPPKPPYIVQHAPHPTPINTNLTTPIIEDTPQDILEVNITAPSTAPKKMEGAQSILPITRNKRTPKQVSMFNNVPIIPGTIACNSPTQSLYQTAQMLFMSTGRMSEHQARSCLTKILKDNPRDNGIIFDAINAAWTLRDEILDPYPWVVRRISNLKKERERQQPKSNVNHGSRQHVTANNETMGISEERIEYIRQHTPKRPAFTLNKIEESA